jgi:hypothetical protein
MTNSLLHWLSDLNRFGIRDASEGEISRRIAFSNVIYISLPAVYLLFMIIDFQSFFQPLSTLRFDQFIVPIEIAICLFCLWLNKKNVTTLSRILFLVTWPFFMHLIPIMLLETPIDYYLAFPFGLVFHALLIQLMVTYRKEPFLFWALIIVNFVTVVFATQILIFFLAAGVQPNPIVFDDYFLLDTVLYWLLFNLVMFYILEVIEKYLKKLNSSYVLIEAQRNELKALNHDLEHQVRQRTSSLENQNKKLRGYAYYNAHLLRGPFCRIQGLVHLLNTIESTEEKEGEIMPRLSENIQELETVIKKIQLIVNSEAEEMDLPGTH